jgi:formylglycine-generating enzyme required for sulfatase activity
MNELTNSLGMTLIRIEPGPFLMGSTEDHIYQMGRMFPLAQWEWFAEALPQHAVEIARLFYLGGCPVTQSQYQAVMGGNPSYFKGSDDLPVENVSWFEAVAFCNTLSEREKRTPFYRIDGSEVTALGGDGYRLPTEAEWEYACRAGTTTLYPFGDDPDALGEFAWYGKNSKKKTHAVGEKKPNAWGLHDMLGNVWEWCADWYDANPYASMTPAYPGAYLTTYRVIRGGGWHCYPRVCRSANRSGSLPAYRYDFLGFRVARGESVR